jgi:hypothetical protein
MKTTPPPEAQDRLARMLREAFPEEPLPEGLAAKVLAGAENTRPRGLHDGRSQWSAEWRRMAATALSATVCGLFLGISLGLGAFGGSGRARDGAAGRSPTYLAHLSGYTDVEDLRP